MPFILSKMSFSYARISQYVEYGLDMILQSSNKKQRDVAPARHAI